MRTCESIPYQRRGMFWSRRLSRKEWESHRVALSANAVVPYQAFQPDKKNILLESSAPAIIRFERKHLSVVDHSVVLRVEGSRRSLLEQRLRTTPSSGTHFNPVGYTR